MATYYYCRSTRLTTKESCEAVSGHVWHNEIFDRPGSYHTDAFCENTLLTPTECVTELHSRVWKSGNTDKVCVYDMPQNHCEKFAAMGYPYTEWKPANDGFPAHCLVINSAYSSADTCDQQFSWTGYINGVVVDYNITPIILGRVDPYCETDPSITYNQAACEASNKHEWILKNADGFGLAHCVSTVYTDYSQCSNIPNADYVQYIMIRDGTITNIVPDVPEVVPTVVLEVEVIPDVLQVEETPLTSLDIGKKIILIKDSEELIGILRSITLNPEVVETVPGTIQGSYDKVWSPGNRIITVTVEMTKQNHDSTIISSVIGISFFVIKGEIYIIQSINISGGSNREAFLSLIHKQGSDTVATLDARVSIGYDGGGFHDLRTRHFERGDGFVPGGNNTLKIETVGDAEKLAIFEVGFEVYQNSILDKWFYTRLDVIFLAVLVRTDVVIDGVPKVEYWDIPSVWNSGTQKWVSEVFISKFDILTNSKEYPKTVGYSFTGKRLIRSLV